MKLGASYRPTTHEVLGSVGAFSRGIREIPHLAQHLRADRIVFRPEPSRASELDAVVGWGHKSTARTARRYAERFGVPYLRLEDGFLRSASVGLKGPPLSLVVDDVGIYYDSRAASRLELMLNAGTLGDPLDSELLLRRARACRRRIVEAHLSKYNNTVQAPPEWLLKARRPIVLVVDQTLGDASIALGGADSQSFEHMLASAIDEHPEATVVVKTHPDVWGGGKRGYLSRVANPRVRVLREAVDAALLLDIVDHVYTVSSQLGFEALLREKPVTCFGLPFYAGWGLTRDRQPLCRRSRRRSLDELVAAALILYPSYVNPVSGQRCEVEQVIEHLALQRAMFEKNAKQYFCFGFTRWKHEFVRHFLKSPQGRVVFCNSVAAARRHGIERGGQIVVWGRRAPEGLETLARQQRLAIHTMEDGFLRSVGLGSDFAAPTSLVLDERGVYYDSGKASDIECMLESEVFSESELIRARTLRRRIVESGISKYNFGGTAAPLQRPAAERVILVPGQVEDDASVVQGSPAVRSNRALLGEVRRLNPKAHIIYKVHPDVASGNRFGGSFRPHDYCDEVVERHSLSECLAIVDEVHTMTSLVGFEALLRGKRVTTYGQPFYAGWGLTEDRLQERRRSRRRTLDELVAAALIRYPRYYSWRALAFVSPEDAFQEIGAQRALSQVGAPSHAGRVGRSLRRARTWSRARFGKPVTLAFGSLRDTRVLMLQGPVGPFFARLAEELTRRGAQVTKVNFNSGDELFFRRGAIHYQEPVANWPSYLERLLSERPQDMLLLFGDTREHHRVAISTARRVGIPVYVFEEGYVRPDFITIERGGVNANSSLPRSLEDYLARATESERTPRRVQHGFRNLAWYSALYSVALTFGDQRYPSYRHHKDIHALRMAPVWLRGIARKVWFGVSERGLLPRLTRDLKKRFFLVPLQVHHDAQVVGSRFGSNEAFISEVLTSFAQHAPLNAHLVFKHHPLDRAYRDYRLVIEDQSRQLGLTGRVLYVHDLHLPSLLRAARGTVVLNSTTGCSSLHHGTPVKVLGEAVYDLAGLTFQDSLERFWSEPGSVERKLFLRYRAGLVALSQVNGCFYSMDTASDVVRWLERAVDAERGR